MNKNCMPTHILLLTSANRVNFATTLSRSSTITMAAAPWWTEHSPSVEISDWRVRSQDIDSSWRNVITWHYTIKGSIGRTLPTTMPSYELEGSWLMPEALHGSEQPCSPSSSQKDNPLTSPQNHLNLYPYHPDPQPQLAFPGSLLAKALLTGPLPLPYRMKMDSSSSVYPHLTIQASVTKSPSAGTARSGDTMKRRVPIVSATSVRKCTRHSAVPSLTAAALTTAAGSLLVTQTMGLYAPPKPT